MSESSVETVDKKSSIWARLTTGDVVKHVQLPIKKPKPGTFFRVSKEEALSPILPVFEDKNSGLIYICHPDLNIEPELLRDQKLKQFYFCCSNQMENFLLPVRVVRDGEALDEWSKSSHIGAQLARDKWVRFQPNTIAGYHDIYMIQNEALLELEPIFANFTLEEMLDIAFRGAIIQDSQHLFLQKLRGRI